ncbi:MAG: MSHA biogenesis protein MshK [Undibacterium sp.]|nr:MSHA biogenesis protein MshK [Undibacterium sp.]
MDQPVAMLIKPSITHFFLSFLLIGPAVFAQELQDPTRPPASLLSGVGLSPVASGPVLQSILIGADRQLAIIDGKTVKLNGKFGNQVLVRLTETEAILREGKGKHKVLHTLRLFPDFQIKPVLAGKKAKLSNTGKPIP